MYLISNIKEESPDFNLDSPKSYEWLYFDVHFEDYYLVIIFFNGNPFSPSYFMNNYTREYGLNISLFQNDKCKSFTFYNTQNRKELFSKLIFEDNKISINLNELDKKGKSINIKLDFKHGRPILNNEVIKFGNDNDKWIINSLKYEVEGNINFDNQNHQIKTLGYHDHNYGDDISSLYQNIPKWYWGYMIQEKIAVNYFYISAQDNKALILIDDGLTVKNYFAEIKLLKFKISRVGMRYASKLNFHNNDFDLNVENIYNQDFKKFGFSGVVYSRSASAFRFNFKGEKYEGEGTSEFSDLKRMNNILFRRMMKYGIDK